MIKFFHHIRQRLLEENRFTKYLLYVVGEIVHLDFGVLIAENLSPSLLCL
jgi:hypothetical protein